MRQYLIIATYCNDNDIRLRVCNPYIPDIWVNAFGNQVIVRCCTRNKTEIARLTIDNQGLESICLYGITYLNGEEVHPIIKRIYPLQ